MNNVMINKDCRCSQCGHIIKENIYTRDWYIDQICMMLDIKPSGKRVLDNSPYWMENKALIKIIHDKIKKIKSKLKKG